MAGYDFFFTVEGAWKEIAKDYLDYSLNIARSLGLESHYRTLSGNETFYVSFDGPLQQMQIFEEDCSRASDYFIRSRFPKLSLRRVKFYDKVLRPYFTANNQGLMAITNMVFRDANIFRGKPIGKVLSPKIYKALNKRGLSERSKKAIIVVIDNHYSFLLGEADKKMLIAVDGAAEDIFKDKLHITRRRVDFPVLVSQALNNNFINKSQSRRLLNLHTHRSSVQHAGKNVHKAKLRSYIALVIEIIKRLY